MHPIPFRDFHEAAAEDDLADEMRRSERLARATREWLRDAKLEPIVRGPDYHVGSTVTERPPMRSRQPAQPKFARTDLIVAGVALVAGVACICLVLTT